MEELVVEKEFKHRDVIRAQFAVKLRRKLNRLSKEAREQFEAVTGETPEATLQRLLTSSPDDISSWFSGRSAVGPILDWQAEGNSPRFLPISHHGDQIVSVSRGYGEAQRPQDFLDSFSAFVRDNVNSIMALRLVVQRPRELTRADLRQLKLTLDRQGFSEASLSRAWADAKNEEIAASIIGFVRQAALGDPLVPYIDRVRAAMRRILASRSWTDPQRRWLKRIGEQVEKEVVIDRAAIDEEPFRADGGFNRLNKVFDGELESVLAAINEETWKEAG